MSGSGATVLIMAGGTGGHVFPALAVAERLRARGAQVRWMGTHAGLEARLVPAAGIPMEWVRVSGLRGKGALSWVLAPYRLSVALAQALAVLRRCRPVAVLGMGGFVAGPGGVAARLLRCPLIIHEQNAIAGLTNRSLARIADRTLEAFAGALPAAVLTGNPVRAEIATLQAPEQRFAGRGGRLRLLVLGGSLGARALNRVLPQALQAMAPELRPEVRHQAGERNLDEAQAGYAQAGIDARVTPFIADMAEAYAWADLVVCRAGALTVAELAAAGVGSILVPFPYAVDDHQTHNAAHLVRCGAAELIQECDLDAGDLAERLGVLAGDRERLRELAVAARRLARPGAAEQVADICLEAARTGRRAGSAAL